MFDREQGLRKAMRVFWSFGNEASSMADLQAALGINQASLYAAYGSKEALFQKAVDLYLKTDRVATPHALASELSTRDAIHALLQDGVDMFTAADVPRGCLLVLSTMIARLRTNASTDTYLRYESRPAVISRLVYGVVNLKGT